LLIDMNSRKWDRLNEYVDKSSWIRGSSWLKYNYHTTFSLCVQS
jgi:hypothetical protein